MTWCPMLYYMHSADGLIELNIFQIVVIQGSWYSVSQEKKLIKIDIYLYDSFSDIIYKENVPEMFFLFNYL